MNFGHECEGGDGREYIEVNNEKECEKRGKLEKVKRIEYQVRLG